MLFKFLSQVQGDDVHVEALTCLLQRLLVSGPGCNQVIILLELGDAEVGSCVREEDVAATQDA